MIFLDDLIGFLAPRLGKNGERLAKPVAIAVLALIAAILIALAFMLSRCGHNNRERAQSRVNSGQAGAFANSAADAVEVQQNAAARERASDDLSRTNEEEIRHANGANAPVDPAVRDAGLRSLCKRAAYRDSRGCKLFKSAP